MTSTKICAEIKLQDASWYKKKISINKNTWLENYIHFVYNPWSSSIVIYIIFLPPMSDVCTM